jgi:hypothetical protein
VVWSADCQVALYGHADDQVDGPTQGDPDKFFYPSSTLRDENRYRYFVMLLAILFLGQIPLTAAYFLLAEVKEVLSNVLVSSIASQISSN